MKKTITILLLTLFTGVLSAQVNIQGNPYGGNPYPTITDAITAAVDGDVILISGIFTEPISITKSITLRGANPATDIIQAAAAPSSDGTGNRVITLTGSGTPITPLYITIENLGIKNGNSPALPATTNGGGIFSDKITGLVTLKNLIIENNYASKNGGGISFDGSNANIIECTIKNNSASTNGGGIIIAPNNGAAIDCVINIKQSLIDSNTATSTPTPNTTGNGGGIYINAANSTTYKTDVTIENSTISNNIANSTTSGVGGGAIYSQNGTTSGLETLKLVHTTFYNNFHAALVKCGLQFGGTSGSVTNFSAYNSIIVSDDDVTKKAINFAGTNTTNIVNCILGGLNNVPGSVTTILDDPLKNNLYGKKATESGLNIVGGLQSLGGKTKVIPILTGTTAVNYCSVATGISNPTIDQRGYIRAGVSDAGAYEFDGTLSIGDKKYENNAVNIYPNPTKGNVTISGVDTINLVRVYSILGSLEKEFHNQNEFNVSDLSRGVHMMVIESNGQKIAKRLIIE